MSLRNRKHGDARDTDATAVSNPPNSKDLPNPGEIVRLPDSIITTPLNSISKVAPFVHGSDDTWLGVILLLSVTFTMQCALAVTGYSGQNKPPLFGDFEAQRHWMEMTVNLPIKEWYINSTNNDLMYWGLDYPPLTAYHSYAMGIVSRHLSSSWVALRSSRGIETPEHRLFMRLSAILPFYILYFPALVYYFLKGVEMGKKLFVSRLHLLAFSVLYPGILLIDNAHFQYNSISLGLFLWSFICLEKEYFSLASVLFVSALNYKQLELYHALPIFVYILARNLKHPILGNIVNSAFSIVKIGLIVMATFALLWLPFLVHGRELVTAVLRRIFPFYRGLYEDKVASFWCAFSMMLKRVPNFTVERQLVASTTLVLSLSLPSLLPLLLKPSSHNFRLALFNVALAFFLFSFHVHEKTILLVAIPAFLLLSERALFRDMVAFLCVSATSMYSLCIKDGNSSFFCWLAALHLYGARMRRIELDENERPHHWFYDMISIGCIALNFLELEWFLRPPTRFPHLFPLASAFVSCCFFMLILAKTTMKMKW